MQLRKTESGQERRAGSAARPCLAWQEMKQRLVLEREATAGRKEHEYHCLLEYIRPRLARWNTRYSSTCQSSCQDGSSPHPTAATPSPTLTILLRSSSQQPLRPGRASQFLPDSSDRCSDREWKLFLHHSQNSQIPLPSIPQLSRIMYDSCTSHWTSYTWS